LERRAELKGIFFRKGAVTEAALYFWHKFGSSTTCFDPDKILSYTSTARLLAVNKSPPASPWTLRSYIPGDNIFYLKITRSSANE
jgi:hypothetical protein